MLFSTPRFYMEEKIIICVALSNQDSHAFFSFEVHVSWNRAGRTFKVSDHTLYLFFNFFD